MPDVVLEVDGMMCMKNCGSTVEGALRRVPGVVEARVVYELKLACIWGTTDAAALMDAVDMMGFDARAVSAAALQIQPSVTLTVPEMMCMKNCGTTITNALMRVDKVIEVQIDLGPKRVDVFGAVYPEECIDALDMVGFDAVVGAAAAPAAGTANPVRRPSEEDLSLELEQLTGGDPARETVTIEVSGMSCAACSGKVERALSALPSVEKATVSLALNRAVCVVEEGVSRDSAVLDTVEAVKDLGYGAEIVVAGANSDFSDKVSKEEIAQWRTQLAVAMACLLPLMGIHMGFFHPSSLDRPLHIFNLTFQKHMVVLFLLATPVQFGVGWRYYRNAYAMLRSGGGMGMDLLVVVGTTAIYLYSTCMLLYAGCTKDEVPPHHVFFEASAMLITFITLGKFLEAMARGHTTNAITSLLKLQPQTAWRLPNEDSDDPEEVPIADLKSGDLLRVEPGARIPCDGEVKDGESYVDESAITGEPMPQRKKPGDTVYGCTVNQHGTLRVVASEVGSKSLMSQIVRLVSEAQMSKAPVQAFADRAAGVFVPVVLTIALITFLTWLILAYTGAIPAEWMADDHDDPFLFALLFGISVVVIACPCTLGLATPTAVMVGTGVSARNGVLIKGGDALERMSALGAIVLDKTGTLTTGKPVVSEFHSTPELLHPEGSPHLHPNAVLAARHELLKAAAAVEWPSEHPIAHAIRAGALAQQLDITGAADGAVLVPGSFRAEVGMGVVGVRTWDGAALCAGKEELMERSGLMVPEAVKAKADNLRTRGMTAVLVGQEMVGVLGVLGISDTVKDDAPRTIAALQRAGVAVYMCTGDNGSVARDVAERLGIDVANVHADCLPGDKQATIRELQDKHGIVAMVGDGINDAPSLAQADIGIAIGAGTAVAVDAADVILIRSRLTDIVMALHLSRTVFKRIQLNFVLAVFYNFIGVPIACGVFFPWTHMRLPAAFAGLSMSMSSVAVVCSSLLLHLYRPPLVHVDGSIEVGAASRYLLCAGDIDRPDAGIVGLLTKADGPGPKGLGAVLFDKMRNGGALSEGYEKLPVAEDSANDDFDEELGVELVP